MLRAGVNQVRRVHVSSGTTRNAIIDTRLLIMIHNLIDSFAVISGMDRPEINIKFKFMYS